MLLTNQCLDKLAALCVDFVAHGMLQGPLITSSQPIERTVSDQGGEDSVLDAEAVEGITSLGDVNVESLKPLGAPSDPSTHMDTSNYFSSIL